mmetsp:Transcript_6123/g.8547  ORF Transcript_6123/g.8547 Transcript_6123/m.8547 type:complete len:203 (-) Transcript_6123:888-1496(-)
MATANWPPLVRSRQSTQFVRSTPLCCRYPISFAFSSLFLRTRGTVSKYRNELQKNEVSAMVTFAMSSSSFNTSIFSTVTVVELDDKFVTVVAEVAADPSPPMLLLLASEVEEIVEGPTGSETPPSSLSSNESDVSNPSGAVESRRNVTVDAAVLTPVVLLDTNTLSIVAHSLPTTAIARSFSPAEAPPLPLFFTFDILVILL